MFRWISDRLSFLMLRYNDITIFAHNLIVEIIKFIELIDGIMGVMGRYVILLRRYVIFLRSYVIIELRSFVIT